MIFLLFSCVSDKESTSSYFVKKEVNVKYTLNDSTRGIDSISFENGNKVLFHPVYNARPDELLAYSYRSSKKVMYVAVSKSVLCNSYNCKADIVLIVDSSDLSNVFRYKTFCWGSESIWFSKEGRVAFKRCSYFDKSDSGIVMLEEVFDSSKWQIRDTVLNYRK